MSNLGKYAQSKYDPKVHPVKLIEIFEKGGDVCNFCSQLNIGERTFYDWIKIHADLAEAYDIAKSKAKVYLTSLGLANIESKDFQFNVWSLLMRNRCKTTEYRIVPIDFTKCKTSNAKVKILEKELHDGNLTPMEAKCFADVIKATAEINEKTEIAKQVDELMQLAGKS